MSGFDTFLTNTLAEIEADGLLKREREITSPQDGNIDVGGRKMLNLCANNYLGLANHPRLIEAAKNAMDEHGYGMASVRFICGTQDLHRELEEPVVMPRIATVARSRMIHSGRSSEWINTTSP